MIDNKVVLEVKNLSKTYRLGEIGTGTISHDLNRWWAKIRGKADPYALVGSSNDRTQKSTKGEYVKVLDGINFEVKQGEVLGIIGKNGAGKSTLLKVISQITSPTTGSIKSKGRVASLLEVGTGMHPEMTGKENVYLNGAILGMTKKEIDSKFDEIMDFAGCFKYANTPVKRYSSGMKVRLGFAVAAFLEPEILIVDEVLAVGDAEFQKKAIGKMQEISSGGGRTVLFVSHNMASIRQLCNRAILLKNGAVEDAGDIEVIINKYLESGFDDELVTKYEFEDNQKLFRHKSVQLFKNGEFNSKGIFTEDDNIDLAIEYDFLSDVSKCHMNFYIKNSKGEIVYFLDRRDFHKSYAQLSKGKYKVILSLPNPLLIPDKYSITFGLADAYSGVNDHQFDVLQFKIENTASVRNQRPGNIFYPLQWDLIRND
jgi:lipopolysaccharide transport system ATP-binding protein